MYYLLLALIVDLLIGDPEFIPHPVVLIGKLISILESGLRKIVTNKISEKLAGIVIVLTVVLVTYFLTFSIIKYSFLINYYLGIVISIWLLATTISLKGLQDAGMKIYRLLDKGDLHKAREAVGQVVGRDTEKMCKTDIIRAAVETIAENTSDGIIAPILFYLIGGIPLAMAYKAVNTLDSMLGYTSDKYRHIGWAAARFDDIINFIPARLTGIGFCLAGFVTGKDWQKGWQLMIRDAGKHPSWNAGFPEAASAGCLGIRLGGLNYYHGKPGFRAYLGEKTRELVISDIKAVIQLMFFNVILNSVIIYLVLYFFRLIIF